MKHPLDISAEDFYYDLPEDKIALHPAQQRSDSKLLVYKDKTITSDTFVSLGNYLPPGCILVFNTTKVISARLVFKNSKGRNLEVFCLEPNKNTEPSLALAATGTTTWNCLVGRLKQWKEDKLELQVNDLKVGASLVEKRAEHQVVQFNWEPAHLSFAEVLEAAGKIPLPPYIKREPSPEDASRYQTVYSKNSGSVAAPTSGLHFTNEIIGGLERQGVKKLELTLHVGAGTFMPVKGNTLKEHNMHAELMEVRKDFLEAMLFGSDTPVVAVGTTSLRCLESLYWLGNKLILQPDTAPEQLQLEQWEAYENTQTARDRRECLEALLKWMLLHGLDRLLCKTRILIAPPYRLRVASALITNFHQPHSTLLMLVSALTGQNWKTIYDYALRNNFRFLSYGDSSLLYPD